MTIASHSAPVSDLATILAKGYLRLTGIAPDSAISGHKELDLSTEESAPVIETGAQHGNNDAP